MFSGWAESVLWGATGPLPYDELGLPAGLVADLERWDLTWSRAARPDAPTSARLDRRAHAREGRRLARQVADALGAGLVLELAQGRWPRWHRRFRGRDVPSVPTAAALVRRLQVEQAAEQARVQVLLDEGETLSWSAYLPGGPRKD